MEEYMSRHQILRDLKYCDIEFPRAAIEAARQHRDEIIPGLIAEIPARVGAERSTRSVVPKRDT